MTYKIVYSRGSVATRSCEVQKRKYDMQMGVYLRKLGWTHRCIAEFLGCSEIWCRQNLAGIEEDIELMKKVAEEAMKIYNIK